MQAVLLTETGLSALLLLSSGNAHKDLMYCLCCAGCSDLTFNITTGLPDAAGAKYVLNMGFKPGAFVFLNETEGNM